MLGFIISYIPVNKISAKITTITKNHHLREILIKLVPNINTRMIVTNY